MPEAVAEPSEKSQQEQAVRDHGFLQIVEKWAMGVFLARGKCRVVAKFPTKTRQGGSDPVDYDRFMINQ
jgi:hypothetical protein